MASRIILVTGGNRGIGLGIVQGLFERDPQLHVIIGCRKPEAAADVTVPFTEAGLSASTLALDVASDASIAQAVESMSKAHGKLDVLVNNAGVAAIPKDVSELRRTYNDTFNVNVASVAMAMELFAPLLAKSSDPRIINVSSARGSLQRNAAGQLPPTQLIAYNVSKAALNLIGIGFAQQHPDILVHSTSPGHCKTAFNRYRGLKDPKDGGRVVVALALEPRNRYESGFWEIEGDDVAPARVPW